MLSWVNASKKMGQRATFFRRIPRSAAGSFWQLIILDRAFGGDIVGYAFEGKEMTKLSVNLNKIALLRNQRNIGIPSVIDSARTVMAAGAHGITVHPRPDERHTFAGKYMEIVRQVKPDQATLVPDAPGANTSDHGWDLAADKDRLAPIVKELKELGVRVSLFMDADVEGIKLAKQVDTDRVELYTEPYATAFRTKQNLDEMLGRYCEAAKTSEQVGLELNAGHDLNLENLGRFLREVSGVLEVSIGHALIAESLEIGLHETVKEYLRVLSEH
jgi:pyridoxine 5-phosphate synthase